MKRVPHLGYRGIYYYDKTNVYVGKPNNYQNEYYTDYNPGHGG